MKKLALCALLLAAAGLVPGDALAFPGPGGPGGPRGPRGPRGPGGPGGILPRGPALLKVAKLVGLSEAQLSRIKKISFDASRKAVGIHSKLQLVRLDLQELMESDKAPSESKALALMDRMGKLETQLKKNHITRLLRIRKTMSLAQWRKLELLHAERSSFKRRGRGRLGPGKGL